MDEQALLLDGESPEWSAGDAEHWIGVYRELISFCRQALQNGDTEGGQRLGRRLAHLEARLAFWSRPGLTQP